MEKFIYFKDTVSNDGWCYSYPAKDLTGIRITNLTTKVYLYFYTVKGILSGKDVHQIDITCNEGSAEAIAEKIAESLEKSDVVDLNNLDKRIESIDADTKNVFSGGTIQNDETYRNEIGNSPTSAWNTGSDSYSSRIVRIGNLHKAEIMFELKLVESSTTHHASLGNTGATASYLFVGDTNLVAASDDGTIKITCLEAPTNGQTDIDVWGDDEIHASGTDISAVAGAQQYVDKGGAWSVGDVEYFNMPTGTAIKRYFYLTSGAAGTAASYLSGRFLIEIYRKAHASGSIEQ